MTYGRRILGQIPTPLEVVDAVLDSTSDMIPLVLLGSFEEVGNGSC
jgi:hypothetical protein